MIIDSKTICKKVSEDNSIDLNTLISINNIVFKEISDWSKQPDTLKVYLKHFGSWYYKKQKTISKEAIFQRVLIYDTSLLDSSREKILDKIKNYNFIISEYEKYLKEKYEIKCKKYGKEAYEAYCLDIKQKKIQKTKENKSI